MERVLVRDFKRFIGKEILFKGWLAQIRKLGGITFLLLRDRTGEIQGVLENRNLFLPSKESCVEVVGVVKEERQAPGGIELLIKEIKTISEAKELPFEIGRERYLNVKLDTLLDYRPLVLRNPKVGTIFRVEAEIVKHFREFLTKKDFLEVFTSKIISQATEGGSALFPIQYFEKKAYLTQSPQFYKQMLVGAGYERVFEVGFVYRAEEHDTSRHLNEYLSLDLEMGFISDEGEVMDLEEELLRYIISRLNERDDYLKVFGISEISFPKGIPRITFDEAKEILSGDKGCDLTFEEERNLARYVKERYDSDFVFVTKFPYFLRPFYTMPDEKRPYCRSFDLLYRGVEVTTGSQRIHEAKVLRENMVAFGLRPEDFGFYLMIFDYGMPPHGGLAIGLERLTVGLLGLRNIREASLFPRDRKRLIP
ncbi:MAG: aspartate--tRNA(Asn) ligase [candidate division WOR-3 bacterium]